jgi:hypothetical protein
MISRTWFSAILYPGSAICPELVNMALQMILFLSVAITVDTNRKIMPFCSPGYVHPSLPPAGA